MASYEEEYFSHVFSFSSFYDGSIINLMNHYFISTCMWGKEKKRRELESVTNISSANVVCMNNTAFRNDRRNVYVCHVMKKKTFFSCFPL